MVNEIIARVSRGSRMDQVYLPKNRASALGVGEYVVIAPALRKEQITPYYYNAGHIEPIKAEIIQGILSNSEAENIIIAGSFLEKGFCFEDIDIIVINGEGRAIENYVEIAFGLKAHIINMKYDALRAGLNTDPLFQMILSRFASKERILLNIKPQINYKLLDLHLLKSKLLPEQFEHLNGKEKYKLARNMIAIKLFIEGKTATIEKVNKEIESLFGKGAVKSIFENTIEKTPFTAKYREVYRKVFNAIMGGISHAKQGQAG
ncbi:MAG TPA: hypothetical protein HA362_07830 [Nanoarchaeota archaeon]|nr:hypothetical protein [Nanoarchaeota archaeon]